MSIIRIANFFRRPWTQVAWGPGGPAGLWTLAGASEGDASGGDATWLHTFSTAGISTQDTNFYSIEQVMFTTSTAATRQTTVEIANMDIDVLPATATPIVSRYLFDTVSDGNDGVVPATQINPKIFIGRWRDRALGGAGTIAIRSANPGAAATYDVKVQGYWWGPGAMNAPGGLIRPPNGIYGA